MATCTAIYATTGECGKAAVLTFVGTHGEKFAECAEHVAHPTKVKAVPVAKVVYCKKEACVEAAMGYEFVAHLAGACGH